MKSSSSPSEFGMGAEILMLLGTGLLPSAVLSGKAAAGHLRPLST